MNVPGAEAEHKLMNTLTIIAEHLIQISLVVSEIWPCKLKSKGVCLFKKAHMFDKIQFQ